MSGGSYNYIASRLRCECENQMYDEEMNDFINDFCNVLEDLEWWQSGDTSEAQYRQTLSGFKAKWFNGSRKERLKGYIDRKISRVKKELYEMIGGDE